MAKTGEPSVLKLAVAQRLRAIQAELGATDQAIAAQIGATRQAWSNWVSMKRTEMPAEEAMIALCAALKSWRMTLDWIYRGDPELLITRVSIRLAARLRGMDPDQAEAEGRASVEVV